MSRFLFEERFDEQKLREFFSNFFPVYADNGHNENFYDSIIYYGYSPHFKELKEGEAIPEYQMQFKEIDGKVVFEKMEEIKSGGKQ